MRRAIRNFGEIGDIFGDKQKNRNQKMNSGRIGRGGFGFFGGVGESGVTELSEMPYQPPMAAQELYIVFCLP